MRTMIIRKCKIDCFQKSCILLCVALFSCSQYDCAVPDDGRTGEGERTSLCIGGVSTGRLEVLTRSAAELTTATDAIGIFQKKISRMATKPFITENIHMELHTGRRMGKNWC